MINSYTVILPYAHSRILIVIEAPPLCETSALLVIACNLDEKAL